ncbi:MAG TPA: hypothetical protein PK825_06765, partial [Bacteroidales bacterium]|nr:hypothetical protein [Bacteroidales bacterium]
FYTTDFFQEAFFYPQHQLISIYYKARFPEPPRFRISTIPFDFEEETEGNQSFRWMRIEDLDPAMITLPVDKRVTELLRQKCR